MKRSPARALVALLAVLALVAGVCSSRDDSDDTSSGGTGDDGSESESSIDTSACGSDPAAEIEGDTIKIVSSYPQSGLTGAFAEIGRGRASYFDKVNADGGVEIAGKTYTLEYEDKDDEYNPQRTVSNIQELVGTDGGGAFAVFSVVGTSNNLAIREFLNGLCVPDLFVATGSVAWGNADYPWLIGSSLVPYSLEAVAFADYLKENQPDAKVAMLRQADEFGDTYQESFEAAIEGSDIELVATEEYPVGSDQVATQVTTLASSGADAFFNGGTLLACPNALTVAQNEGWEPLTWVSGTCVSKTLMGAAGSAGDGVLSLSNIMDPLNPEDQANPAMVEMQEAVAEYQPDWKGRELDPENAIIGYGWTQAELFVQALEAAEAPSRLAVMEAITNLDGATTSLMLPDISVTTGDGDRFMGETFSLMQYDGAEGHFNRIGELIDFEGKTADNTPEALINVEP